jgi:hypothetical protein
VTFIRETTMTDPDENARLLAIYRRLLIVVAANSSLTEAARTAALDALHNIAKQLGRNPEEIKPGPAPTFGAPSTAAPGDRD